MPEPGAHLLRTLRSQPNELERLLQETEPIEAGRVRLAGAGRLFLVGTGTSFHGALFGEFLFRSLGRDARAVRAFEFSNYPPPLRDDDALILLSHRGFKRFSRDSLDHFAAGGRRWVAISGNGSTLEGEGIIRTVDQEISPVHTASHTAAMLRLAQLAGVDGLDRIPPAVEAALASQPVVAEMAGAIDVSRPIQLIGGGPAFLTALEGALKLREASYVQAEGHELESVLHGPLVSLDSSQAAVVVAETGASQERAAEVAAALEAIGLQTLAVGSAAGALAARWRVETPADRRLPEVLAPIINVVPLQWLAYELARRRGVDADSFRRQEGPYARAQELFKL
jgi:glucosamine--fructose-6-phosphate aminotransferase (isomerizing)